METVKVEIKSEKKANRLEVIIRILYGIILGIIMYLVMLVMSIITIINYISCLVLAKRFGTGTIARIITWVTGVFAYITCTTDERPPLIP